ncbi:putative minor tail protein L [uncultured virus]|uniref:Putative minor tail protein L n=1 Tax=uncultured virus TaxID=340016 RepID=A0A218MK99_9VIRU|nr:putative minor tail protein L [uncultured virus]
MSARTYDVILTVDNAVGFVSGNAIIGNTSVTVGTIANVDLSNNTVKVRIANTISEFRASESIHSNAITITANANAGLTNTTFFANTYTGNTTTAAANITNITPSPFIAEKNSFTQNPIVRLYSLYYPGEWYPPNPNGNPTGQGVGRAYPVDIPYRFAEVRGDLISDINYRVKYDGIEYIPYPVNISAINTATDGKINELTLEVSNFDNIISTFVEDPFLTGNNTTNSVIALVNHEFVHGIDPRTVNATPAQVGSEGEDAFDSLTRARANGLAFSSDVVGAYGTANASFTRSETLNVNGTWQEQKMDTRDLLGGVVEIKSSFAQFLDYWPEYSTIRTVASNVVEMVTALPYRVGDNVQSQYGDVKVNIQRIEDNRLIYLSGSIGSNVSAGDGLFIVNEAADVEAYVEDTFKIDQLESLNENAATFGLISWLQYFRSQVPKRKYYKNTCQWVYKGEECQYPGPGGLAIPGTTRVSNANPIAANNEIASDGTGDVCGKNIQACTLRNNQHHFGAFPTTGRTIPKQ